MMYCFDTRPKPLFICGLIGVLLIIDICLRLREGCDQQTSTRVDEFVAIPKHLSVVHAQTPSDAKQNLQSQSHNVSKGELCETGAPCVYADTVDLRIIVMTFNRASALSKLLESIALLDSMGDTIALDIWIDRNKAQQVHEETVRTAQSFHWDKGPFGVHIQSQHAGIYGQWIDTWRPRSGSNELALLLEDDLMISQHTWRWLKAAHAHYGQRDDILGYTLQSEKVSTADSKRQPLHAGDNEPAFMYKLVGSWGFAPHPRVWRGFQDWFHKVYPDKSFHPYVPGLILTKWYKGFEKAGTQDSMWTMWFIYYTNERNLYCVVNNLNHMTKSKDKCLSVHRAEPGLHYKGRPRANVEKLLLSNWSSQYVAFSPTTTKFDWNGEVVQD